MKMVKNNNPIPESLDLLGSQAIGDGIGLKTKTGTTARTEPSAIAQYYAGKTLFITGVTGFLGKVLLYKIFKSCPDVAKIYVLLRGKRGTSPQARLTEMLHTIPFTLDTQKWGSSKTYLDHNGSFDDPNGSPFVHLYHKVQALEGDITKPDLGLSDADKLKLFEECEVVFHVAASIKFEAPLKYNMKHNAEGTLHVLNLCEKMKRLDCLMHTSTAYTNCHMDHIPEKVVPLKASPIKLMEAVASATTDRELEEIKMKHYEGRPNSYVFTKAVAEQLVADYEASVPAVIFRPSIVMPSLIEPIPGWLDSPIGPAGLATMAAVGLLRDFDWNYWARLDGVPVDSIINYMITIPWYRSIREVRSLEVYNATNHRDEARKTLGYVFQKFRAASIIWPSKYMVRVPIHPPRRTSSNPVSLWFTMLFSHILVAKILDLFISAAGHKPIVGRVVTRMHKAFAVMGPFTKKTFTFDHTGYIKVDERMSPQDRAEFDLMVQSLAMPVDEYLTRSYLGLRRFILKDTDSSIPRARIQLKVLTVINWLTTIGIWFLIAYLMHKVLTFKLLSTSAIGLASTKF